MHAIITRSCQIRSAALPIQSYELDTSASPPPLPLSRLPAALPVASLNENTSLLTLLLLLDTRVPLRRSRLLRARRRPRAPARVLLRAQPRVCLRILLACRRRARLVCGLLVVGLYIRLHVSESPEFLAAQASRRQAAARERESTGAKEKPPLLQVLRDHPRNLVLAFGARIGETGTSNLINAFGLYYVATVLGLDRGIALNGILIASAIGLVVVPFLGRLSDRIGRRPIYLTGAVAGVVLAFPVWLLFDSRSTPLIYLAFVLVYVLVPTLMFSVQTTFFSELFGTNVRYTGMSLAYQVSAIVGGFIPTIAIALLAAAGDSPWLVAALFALICIITGISVALVRATPAAPDAPTTAAGPDAALAPAG